MATKTHTFSSIFKTIIESQEKTVALGSIVIPIIQRDYAQGRKGIETDRVRMRFLNALYRAVTDTPITLDFVYGDIDEGGVMTPLDGQQRLTTLFLLYWYAAKKEVINKSEYSFLSRFSYETRYSARDFCSLLVDFMPSFQVAISKEIIDQHWFPLDWLKDQTISSMLVMIDEINDIFAGIPDLWQRLISGAISFYFLPIKDMGLTDELYIKMNSRGKPLTSFEHFKAELDRNLKEIDANTAKRILKKIDVNWTHVLWPYRGDDNVIDDEFLRYFRFVCDILCYRSGSSPQGKSGDEFELLKEYFSSESEQILDNIKTLEDFFDCWCHLDGAGKSKKPRAFLERFISYKHETRKIKVETRYNIDIFEDCLRSYADIIGGRNRKFPLNRIILLYSIVIYLLHKDEVTEAEFIRRLRLVNNLARNSEFEISDSENRSSGNRMPTILSQVDSIMISGCLDDNLGPNFNTTQAEEEKEKLLWCETNAPLTEQLFELEDHSLLYGQISVVGLETPEYFPRFKSLFVCNWDAVDCALLAMGNYTQTERNGWRHQLGTSNPIIDTPWRNLFHKGANNGYDETRKALRMLLSKAEEFTDELLRGVADNYLFECNERQEFDWKFYYIKYASFRPGRYGKYFWKERSTKPYEFLTLWAEYSTSTNSRQPFLYEIDSKNINRDDYGSSLLYDTTTVRCENSAYVIYDIETGKELTQIEINQNQFGVDTEDRIVKGIAMLPSMIESLDAYD